MSYSVLAVAVLFVVAVSGQQSPNCPNILPLSNLESARIAGEWNGLFNAYIDVPAPEVKCLKANLQVDNNGVITSRGQYFKGSEKVVKVAIGTPIDGNRARLNFITNSDPNTAEIINIVNTDYDNYIIWASCKSKDGQNGYYLTVLSKQQSLSPELLNKVKQQLRAANVSDQLNQIPQTNC